MSRAVLIIGRHGQWGGLTTLAVAFLLLAACGGSTTAQKSSYGSGAQTPIASPSVVPSPKASSAAHSPSPSALATARPAISPKPLPSPVKGGGGASVGGVTTPRTGTYSYSYDSTSSGSSPSSGSADLGVATGSPVASGYHQVFTQSTKASDGSSQSITDDVIWSSSARTVISSTFSASGVSIDCAWSPARLDMKLPLQPGETWTNDSHCDVTFGGQSGTVRYQDTAKVTTNTPSFNVGGKSVATVQVDSTVILTFTFGANSQTSTQDVNSYFSSRYGISIKEVASGTSPDPLTGKTSQTTTTVQLKSLDPT